MKRQVRGWKKGVSKPRTSDVGSVGQPRSIPGAQPKTVEFSREVSLAEFLRVSKIIASIDGQGMSGPATLLPMEGIRAGEHSDTMLTGDGVEIRFFNGALPKISNRSVRQFGVGSGMLDQDLEIVFAAFPDLKVRLRSQRGGRPRMDVQAAQLRGARAQGKTWEEVGRTAAGPGRPQGFSGDAARHLAGAVNRRRA